nr:polyphosphate kinase 1 [Dorea sp. OM07-5]
MLQTELWYFCKRQKSKRSTVMKNIYCNRELSWLKFNERVLEEAESKDVPLCERLTFASIFQTNLDEFFMVRVGSLQDQMLLHKEIRDNKTKKTAKEQIEAILEEVKRLGKRHGKAFENLLQELEAYGVRFVDFRHIDEGVSQRLERYFKTEIAPLISPTIISKRQPFPFLRNKDIYIVAVLETKSKKERLGIIPCSNNVFKRLIELPDHPGTFMLSEEFILHYVPEVFKGYRIKAKSVIRITRNADIDADALYDEDLDYRDFMADLIKKRKKLTPVRIEFSREMNKNVVATLCKYLEMDKTHVFLSDAPLDLSFVFEIQDRLRKNPELFYEKKVPQKSPMFQDGESILAQIRREDKLLSYPYESIRPFLHMLNEAAEDPDVISIKMTLYRLAKQSKVVEALVEAAENGKEVIVLVELRARFDEENNIEWSRRLEDAGCQVIYGLDGYKVHSKLCLITRKNDNHVEYFTQIGTGNYNEKTSRLYTDLSLMTSDPAIGLEASNVFQALLKGEVVEQSEKLLVAPKCLQNRVLEMIDEEIEHARHEEPAYVGVKLNSLTDKKIIDKLAEASKAGVKIDLVIRGICCLLPGVPEKTENIRVISIVGRFLEHSRIYIFGTEERSKVYIASADFMTRNTVRRVEVAAPVEDVRLKECLLKDFRIMLNDNVQARKMNPDGNYTRIRNDKEPLSAQEYFYEEAYKKAGKKEQPQVKTETAES